MKNSRHNVCLQPQIMITYTPEFIESLGYDQGETTYSPEFIESLVRTSFCERGPIVTYPKESQEQCEFTLYEYDPVMKAKVWKQLRFFRNDQGEFTIDMVLHREDDLPAVVHDDGTEEWWKDGCRHNKAW